LLCVTLRLRSAADRQTIHAKPRRRKVTQSPKIYRKIPFTLFQTFFNPDSSFGFGRSGDFTGLAVAVGLGEGEGDGEGVGLAVAAAFEFAAPARPGPPRHQRAASTPEPTITINKKSASTNSCERRNGCLSSETFTRLNSGRTFSRERG